MDDVTALYRELDPLRPLRGDEDALYVDWQQRLDPGARNAKSRIVQTFRRNATAERPITRLLTGHRGCGKTTELNRLRDALSNGGHERRVFVSMLLADEWLDLEDVQPEDLVLQIVRQLSRDLSDAGVGLAAQKLTTFFATQWQRAKRVRPTLEFLESLGADPLNFSFKLEHFPIARDEFRALLRGQLTTIFDLVNRDLLPDARAQLKRIGYDDLLLIVDDLDRIPEKLLVEGGPTNQHSVFLDGSSALRAINCSMLLTVPIELAHSPAQARLRDIYGSVIDTVPLLPVTGRDGTRIVAGEDALIEMIGRRARRALSMADSEPAACAARLFVDEELLRRVVQLSGGHIRSLLVTVSQLLDWVDELPISAAVVDRYATSTGRDFARALFPGDREVLRTVAEKGTASGDPRFLELLRNLYVMHHDDAERGGWYAVNPLVRDLIVGSGPPSSGVDLRKTPRVSRPVPPPGLIQALGSLDCVLIAGTGLAKPSAPPTSNDMLSRMISILLTRDGEDRWGDLADRMALGEEQLVAELVRVRLPTDELATLIRQASTQAGGRTPTEVMVALARLPFVGVIATQWDSLLLDALAERRPDVLTPRDGERFPALLRYGRFFVVQAYGDANSGDWNLTDVDYRRSVVASPTYERFVGALVSSRTLLFLGSSIAAIERFLVASGVSESSRREHWGLVPSNADFALDAERLAAKYRINLLPYSPSSAERDLTGFVEMLGDGAPRTKIDRRAKRAAPTLTELRLHGIGPFEDLHLRFPEQWTVLLGDNGVGKSSVLRAIALALSGEWHGSYLNLDRLLNVNADVGRIELVLGRDTFLTTLVRDGARVRVSAEQITPVQSGAWLALGFPPLRGVPGADPHGVVGTHAANPSPNDLLPLVTNAVDTRFSELRQWLVNVAVNAELPEARPHYQRTLDTFFDLVRAVTPGLHFDYDGYDRDTYSIRLRTEDGPISITQLSQGMTAVLSWVGVLIQRLFEVYETDERPQDRPVLVLVDELDAHLHPEWQRKLVPILRDSFPNMQLVATTHSPLVVGSTEPGELIRLRRSNGGLEALPVQADFAGWRSDQILTSHAFGLPLARDRDTEAKIEEYKRLRLSADISPAQAARMEALAAQLGLRLPPPRDTAEGITAARMVREWLAGELSEASDDEKLRMIEEAELYLARLQAGG